MSKLNQVIHLELITESGMNPSDLQMWIWTKMKWVQIMRHDEIIKFLFRNTNKQIRAATI